MVLDTFCVLFFLPSYHSVHLWSNFASSPDAFESISCLFPRNPAPFCCLQIRGVTVIRVAVACRLAPIPRAAQQSQSARDSGASQ